MSYQLPIIMFTIMSIWCVLTGLGWRTPRSLAHVLRVWIFYLILTLVADWRLYIVWWAWWLWLCGCLLSIFCVVVCGCHLLVVCVSFSWFDTQGHAMHMMLFLKRGQLTDQGVDVSGLWRVSFGVIISRILRSLWWPCLRLQIITNSSYVDWFISYPLLDCHFHTRFDDG